MNSAAGLDDDIRAGSQFMNAFHCLSPILIGPALTNIEVRPKTRDYGPVWEWMFLFSLKFSEPRYDGEMNVVARLIKLYDLGPMTLELFNTPAPKVLRPESFLVSLLMQTPNLKIEVVRLQAVAKHFPEKAFRKFHLFSLR
jgi:hypothetical protein